MGFCLSFASLPTTASVDTARDWWLLLEVRPGRG